MARLKRNLRSFVGVPQEQPSTGLLDLVLRQRKSTVVVKIHPENPWRLENALQMMVIVHGHEEHSTVLRLMILMRPASRVMFG
jgi:hypothetical protein